MILQFNKLFQAFYLLPLFLVVINYIDLKGPSRVIKVYLLSSYSPGEKLTIVSLEHLVPPIISFNSYSFAGNYAKEALIAALYVIL